MAKDPDAEAQAGEDEGEERDGEDDTELEPEQRTGR